MTAMDRFLNFMKLNDEEDEYDDSDYYEDVIPEEQPKHSFKENSYEEDSKKPKSLSKITPLKNTRRANIGNGMEVCVIRPSSVEDGREITETLLANRTVVLNLEGLDVDIAQRIIDFTSGSCFAINGNLQKISHYIFIITPNSVDISGDFQDLFSGSFDVQPINNAF
ncbi:MAG: cell division protein SepF [Eubacteriales bacterium]